MYFPIMMNLKGKKIVIVGGGPVAFQKLKAFQHTNANIHMVSPEITEEVKKWLKEHYVTWHCKNYESSDLEDANLIIAATNQRHVNDQIRKDKKPHQLFLQVDDPEASDFIMPAVIRRGKLSVAISTDGASPGLTRKLKKELEQQFDERYGEYVEFLERARKSILKEITDSEMKRTCLHRILDSVFYDLTIDGKYEERDELFQQLLLEGKNE